MKAAATNKKVGSALADDLTEEDFRDENVKVRITIYLDLDLVKHFKAQAAKPGAIGKYQTLINQALREKVYGDVSIHQRLAAVEETLTKLQSGRSPKKRIAR